MQRPAIPIPARTPDFGARAAALVRSLAGRPVLVVGSIALVSFAVAAWYSLRVNNWFVMTDELLYVKLAVSIWDGPTLTPSVHGEPYSIYSLLYPLLLAPLVGLLDMPLAFDAAHALGALLVASVAGPSYLLSRSAGLPRAAGYVVAALSVSVPWITMSMVLWTEAAGYAGFAWGVYGMQRTLVDPGLRGDAIALGGVAVAALSRTQFMVLIPLLPVVLALHEVGYALTTGSRRAALREALRRVLGGHKLLLAVYALIGIAALVMSVRSGLGVVLGTYSAAYDGDLLPPDTFRLAGQHLSVVGVAVGIVPVVLAGGWALASLVAPASRERHALAVLGIVVVAALALLVGSFTVRFSAGFQDRYFFYVVPLFFAGMAAALLDGRRSWPGIALAGVGFWAVVDSVSFESGSMPPFFSSPAAVSWSVLDGRAYELGRLFSIDHLSPVVLIEILTLVFAAALVAAVRFIRPGRALLLAVSLPVLAFTTLQTLYVFDNVNPISYTYVARGPQEERDWVDDAAPDDAIVGVMPTVELDAPSLGGWWDVEFWNKSITRSYALSGGITHTPFAAAELNYDPASGAVESANQDADYMVMETRDYRVRLAGDVVATDIPAVGRDLARNNKLLIELERPYRADFAAEGLSHIGHLAGGEAAIRFYPGAGEAQARTVTLGLRASELLDPALPEGPQLRRRYRLEVGDRTVRGVLSPSERRELVFTVCFPGGRPPEAGLAVTGNGFYGAAPGITGLPIGIYVTSIRTAEAPRATCPA